ncbi:Na+/H+ antiporter NhaC family protein [Salisediminibacterium selenitireducens]|uniref:Na+/H+ antiporter NhaC-like protein n=1 Tax=Bacillus selenitireducens (strain ATCC 700615 / DSM 15326 / MLS10) TaxID=439292 RepID=D6Y0D8_BACIE|nr:Na+/H+ antiporter NhaC family protein [Salisediminibacterium selenitireducens]ADH98529.1 Na+/H+ antiporter NhaC-like protein [[Bacillus] selenitireducens MLS10]
MPKDFTTKELTLILTLTIGGLIIAISTGLSLTLGITPGFLSLLILARNKHIPLRQLVESCKKGLIRNKDVAWLLVFIGILLPTWYVAGTVDDLNRLFLTLISPAHFFLSAFLVTGIMSFIVGSSIGSLSIVGVPIMATAEQMGISVLITAGALVSGSFIGDRTSPLSSSFFLLAHSVEVTVKTHFRSVLPTMFITATVTAFLYAGLDLALNRTEVSSAGSLADLSLMETGLSLVPPFLLLLMILTGQSMRLSFLSGIIAGIVLILIRGESLTFWFTATLSGIASLNGLWQMLPFIVFILTVGMFSQMIEDTKLLQPVIESRLTNTTDLSIITRQSIGIATAVSLISPNQAFPIIVTARSLLPHWNAHFSPQALGRVLADSTVVFAGIVPWSLLAILNSSILGIPVLHYIPFAFFLLLSPAVTILWSTVKSP